MNSSRRGDRRGRLGLAPEYYATRIPLGLREAELARLIQLSRVEMLAPYLTQRMTKEGKILDVSMTSSALLNEAGQMYAVATAERARGTG